MPRVTLENLDTLAREAQGRHAGWKSMLMVCAGTGCVSAKSLPLRDAFRQELERRGLQDEIKVVATGSAPTGRSAWSSPRASSTSASRPRPCPG
jgi:hypothetical protein